ncbi:MAG: TlpA family protein disulfide reductase [Deltaproteobacteria bacterium]|nr:TlpA family protein disulfide reductase [Deltaproteobacteria bacterium]
MRTLGRAFIYAALCLLVLVGSGKGFFHKRKEPTSPAQDYFEKLGIERPGKKIPAPEFALEALSGKHVALKDLRSKVVFLNFWATWCVPCRQEMPAMEKLHRELKDHGVTVVAINFRESRKEVQKFFNELGLTFTALLDKNGAVSEDYGAWSIPVSYFIDRRGAFLGKAVGPRRWDSQQAKEFFRGLLEEKTLVEGRQ